MNSTSLHNVQDYEKAAAQILSPIVYDYYRGGAEDEIALRSNILAFSRIKFRPHVLRPVSNISTSVTIAGHTLSLPVIVAPMAMQKMAHEDGEIASATAARELGVGYTLSTLSTCSIEEVAKVSGDLRLFQLYVYKDREVTKALVRRARRAGFSVLVLTVDTPILGKREKDEKNAFRMPSHLKLGNFSQSEDEKRKLPGATAKQEGQSALAMYGARLLDSDLSWDDVGWLVRESGMPVWLKGIVREDDARQALRYGVEGIVVSNHGGRQLDGVMPTIDALEEVVKAVNGRVPVLVDSGIRRGSDIVRAIACGATAVMIGRPVLWGLAVDGTQGVINVLKLLKNETALTMALCGTRSCEKINRDIITRQPGSLAKL